MIYVWLLVFMVMGILGFFGGLYAFLVIEGTPIHEFPKEQILTISGALLFEYAPRLANSWLSDYTVTMGQLDMKMALVHKHFLNEKAAIFGVLGSSISLVVSVFLVQLKRLSQKRPANETTAKVEPSDLEEESRAVLKIGTREIPYEYEAEHLIAVGATGVGKSQAIRAAVKVARKRKNPALVLDIGGELTSRLYRPEKDFIIAAHDARSVDWSPLAEMEGDYDAERLAAAMIPLGHGGDSEEWARMARIYAEAVLMAVFDRHSDQKPATNTRLAAQLSSADPNELLEIVGDDSPAAGLLRPGAERMLASVVGTATSKASALRSLPPEGGVNGWSIKKWVSKVCDTDLPKDDRDSWLFVPIPHEYGDSGKPLASIIAGFVVQSVLSMPESDRRLWFFCDELGQYPQINAMSEALTLGRKYGLCCVHAVQTVDQLEKHYGRNGFVELLANYGAKIMFRQGDDRSAEWSSLQIGDAQVRRIVINTSTSESGAGASSSTTTSESQQEQYSIEREILPAEFMGLPKLHACIKTTSKAGEAFFSDIPYLDIGPQKEPAFVPRKRARNPQKQTLIEPEAPEKTERENTRLPKPSDADFDDIESLFNAKNDQEKLPDVNQEEPPKSEKDDDKTQRVMDALNAGIEIAAGGAEDPDDLEKESKDGGRQSANKSQQLRAILSNYDRG
ncbi:hypothetical protein EHN06_20950 (plasmid) [Marinobacter sp. NP-4(2019)]|uniref:type IV secretion system DNA-binding domain-containing protein n=1 Tax=Marinobacter sp. NP-4(2019) TaxID=2488665 RepID=UPI000FC3D0E2|nr:type IV secretion system DNA-binding domain-containing protein [Marinobacter sp. NP-4(2019)]AZT86086.1 hypothetical protein EHN06_20950 [Marinobacter sp. NP-4(2019)]